MTAAVALRLDEGHRAELVRIESEPVGQGLFPFAVLPPYERLLTDDCAEMLEAWFARHQHASGGLAIIGTEDVRSLGEAMRRLGQEARGTAE